MKYSLNYIIVIFLCCSSSVYTQCYDLSVQKVSMDAKTLIMEDGSAKTKISFLFCNDGDAVPNDPAGNSSISICSDGTASKNPPIQNKFDIRWREFSGCWYGTLDKGYVLPKACDTITIETENTIVVNLQPAGIITVSSCFDPKDDFIHIQE